MPVVVMTDWSSDLAVAQPRCWFRHWCRPCCVATSATQPQQIDNAAQIYVCVTAPEVLGGAMKVAQRLRQCQALACGAHGRWPVKETV